VRAFKVEVLQRGGSFKVRGAANFLASLSAEERARGVVAASAGNHAQGVALAAAAVGVSSHVVMPVGTALPKENATREYGAEVRLRGADLCEATTIAKDLAAAEGGNYVPPFDDPRIIAGQGTLGLELLEEVPDLETVILPVGGGGLAAGVGIAIKHQRPDVRVIGVQAAAVPGAARSHGLEEPLTVPARWTLADGCAVPQVGHLTLPLLNAYVDEIVTVAEEWIGNAIVWLLERSNLVVEGAGAVGVAALLSGAVDPGGGEASPSSPAATSTSTRSPRRWSTGWRGQGATCGWSRRCRTARVGWRRCCGRWGSRAPTSCRSNITAVLRSSRSARWRSRCCWKCAIRRTRTRSRPLSRTRATGALRPRRARSG